MKALEDDTRVTLAMLCRHINTLGSPLYRLPLDMFPEIASRLTSEMDLVNMTHVSYHLRSTLLSHPSLWSNLNFKHETRARAFLERSGQTSLHIDMPRNADRAVRSLAELRQQSKRISTLKLHHWSIQNTFLSEPMPSLRRLEVFFDHYYDDDWDDGWDDGWDDCWDDNVISPWGSTPKWWHPKETEETTSWSFPSLTSLIIYNLNSIPFHAPHLTRFKFWNGEGSTDTDALLCFLNNCPLLEHINIFYSSGHQNGRDLIVSLPNLRTYTETTFRQACPLTVLNMLSLPPFCSVTLRSQDGKTGVKADDIVLHLKSPDYLTEITRVKLRTTHDANGNEVAGALELVNAKGMRVCSERVDFEKKGYRLPVQSNKDYPHNVAHLNFFRILDGRSVEILCIDGCPRRNVVAVDFLEGALGFGNVKTLILSRRAVVPCLSILNQKRWFSPVYTLVVCPDPDQWDLQSQVLQPLLCVAQKRKVAGFPFKSVSLYLRDDPGCEVVLELRKCVGRLELVLGDDTLDWDVDKYFLDGLDHLWKNQDVRWNRNGMYIEYSSSKT